MITASQLLFIALWVALTYTLCRSLYSQPVHRFLATVFWLPFNLVLQAAITVNFIRLMKGVPVRRRITPMIGFERYRWSRSRVYKFCQRIVIRRDSFRKYGAVHLLEECQSGQPCITFYGFKQESRDTVKIICQLFTVELLHHLFQRMGDYIDECFERIHGKGPYPKIITPGPPYSHPVGHPTGKTIS